MHEDGSEQWQHTLQAPKVNTQEQMLGQCLSQSQTCLFMESVCRDKKQQKQSS